MGVPPIVPHSRSRDLSHERLATRDRLAIPACQACNGIASVVFEPTLAERVARVKAGLRQGYAVPMATAEKHRELVARLGLEETERRSAAVGVLGIARLGFRAGRCRGRRGRAGPP